ncbi:DUF5360 family protein [Sulfitobacter pacificus]|uniref:Uncharacterized protein n=1 Tax=Sulfitobacter pacificus TaxID=1499314 RepID=A0ABQ5VIB7_9RHOB|nr:DUF5360 family protein [Sulfitobacter pacificus]GLQ26817.1 hypothetical protein GCM10007927_16200 [Sulfitobacter pacificus]
MKIALTVTEVGMLIYWGFASVVVLGWVIVAPDAMYPYYRNPLIVIWNWSFLPIDILFALCGLAARFVPMAPERAVVLQIVSLTLMFCAGLMALNFWVLQCWFDIAWWAVNAWLVVLSLTGLLRIFCPSERPLA